MKKAKRLWAVLLLAAVTACTRQELPGLATAPPSLMATIASTPAPLNVTPPAVLAPTVSPTSAPAPSATMPAPRVSGNIVRINTPFGLYPNTLDPQQVAFVNEIGVVGMIYEGLLRLNTDLTLAPGAAERWQVSNDGLTYTFTLRAGLKYSDGQPLTARNFEYALKRAVDPLLATPIQAGLFMIAGAEAYGTADAKATSTEQLQKLRDAVGVKARDDTTLDVRLVKPAAYFPYLATFYNSSYPARQDIIERAGDTWWTRAENLVGNGPFMVKELREKERIVLVPNPHWRGPHPAADQVVYRFLSDTKTAFEAYKSGELDLINLEAEDLVEVERDAALRLEVLQAPGSCTQGLAFNLTKPPFDQRDVRLAFAKAVDRTAWTRDVWSGTASPALAWLPDGIPGANPNAGSIQAFDSAAARALLAQSGYLNGPGLPEIKLTFPSTSRDKIRHEFLASQFQRNLGITVALDPIEPQTLVGLERSATTFPALSLFGWCTDYPNPQNWLSLVWRSTALAQVMGYQNQALDRLLDAADAEQNTARRLELYQQAEKIVLTDDVAFAPLHHPKHVYLVKPTVSHGRVTPVDWIFPGWFEPWQLSRTP